jgi:membrane protease YdiL (CAAX protease family)
MLVFSLFFILNEKLSAPRDHFQRTENVFSLKLQEGYGKYFFYYSEISEKDISSTYFRTMTERINHPFSWLYYSLLMKVVGSDQEAFEGFSVFREKAQKVREIDDHDINLLSRIVHEEISADELSSVLVRTEKLEIGWFQHIVSLLLYRSLEMKEKADTTRELAMHEAYGTVKKVLFISTLLFFLFIAGIMIIIMGVKREKIFQSFDKDRLYKLDALYLFETFIMWLFIATLLKIILASSGNLVKMIKSLDLILRICILSAIYVLPCVSFLYLRKNIKQFSVPREELYIPHGKILKDVLYGIGGYCASIPLLFLSAIIIIPIESKLEKVLPTPSNPAIALVSSSKTASEWILLFLLIACIAPVVEEVVFRGILQNAIKRKAGPWIGIFLSACIFSFLHPQLPIGFLPILVIGIVFGILAEARKSLIPSIIAHGMNNGVIIAFVSAFT